MKNFVDPLSEHGAAAGALRDRQFGQRTAHPPRRRESSARKEVSSQVRSSPSFLAASPSPVSSTSSRVGASTRLRR